MNKRVYAFLLALCLVLNMFSGIAIAEEKVCDHQNTETTVVSTEDHFDGACHKIVCECGEEIGTGAMAPSAEAMFNGGDIAATCTEAAKMICTLCNNWKYMNPTGEGLGHTYEDKWAPAEEYAEDACHVRVCTVCGEGEQTGAFVEDAEKAIAADCIHNAKKVCAVCAREVEVENTATGEHKPETTPCTDDYVAPTCQEDGHDYIHCEVKDGKTEHLIKWDEAEQKWVLATEEECVLHDPNAHKLQTVQAQEYDCLIGGWPAYQYCTVEGCDYTTLKEGELQLPDADGAHGELVPAAGTVVPTCADLEWTLNAKLEVSLEGYCKDCGKLMNDEIVIKIEHNWEKQPDMLPTDCTADGYKDHYICLDCDAEIKTTVPALDHTPVWTNGNSGVNCEQPGRTPGEYCSVCGEGLGDEPSEELPVEHTYTIDLNNAVPVTCVTNGKKTDMKCEVCGDVKVGETIVAVGSHDFSIRVPGTPATCEDEGTAMNMKCSVCGELKIKADKLIIPATGHSYESGYYPESIVYEKALTSSAGSLKEWLGRAGLERDYEHDNVANTWVVGEDKAADCENDGFVAEHFCAFCGESLNGEAANEELGLEKAGVVAKWNHKYNTLVENGTMPTCTEEGVSAIWQCSNEGCAKTIGGEKIQPLGHDFEGNFVDVKMPTCEEDGHAAYSWCERCHLVIWEKQTIVDADVNNLLLLDIAAVTEKTSTAFMGVLFNGEFVIPGELVMEKYEHTSGAVNMEKMDAVKPTCVDTGREAGAERCLKCGTVINEKPLPTIPHNVVIVPKVDATCTDAGNVAYVYCTICNMAAKQNAMTGSLADEQKNLTNSTIEMPEQKDGEPLVHPAEFIIEAKGHTEAPGEKTEPTCEKPGKEAGIWCTVCGVTLVEGAEIPALTHHYVLITPAEAPTCTKDGKEALWACNNKQCDDWNEATGIGEIINDTTKDGTVIPATGHSKGIDTDPIDPTCTTVGWTAGMHCAACISNIDYEAVKAYWNNPNGEVTGADLAADGWLIIPEMIEKDGHTWERQGWSNTMLVTEPVSCTESYKVGYFKCEDCDEHLGTIKPAYNHADKFVVTGKTQEAMAPTCYLAGYTGKVEYCPTCNQYMGQTVPAIGHKNAEFHAAVAPKCNEDGVFAYWACPDCDANFKADAKGNLIEEKFADAEALINTARPDHVKKHVDAAEPTCTTDGHTSGFECTVCKETFYDIIKKDADAYHAKLEAKLDEIEWTLDKDQGLYFKKCDCCDWVFATKLWPEPVRGDVNGDGVADARDARQVLEFAAGLRKELKNEVEANFNGTDGIDARDARDLLNFVTFGVDPLAGK